MSCCGLFVTEEAVRDNAAMLDIAISEINRIVDLTRQDRREVNYSLDRISAATRILEKIERDMHGLHQYLLEEVQKHKAVATA